MTPPPKPAAAPPDAADAVARARAVLDEASAMTVTPPLLHPADTFVALAGEEFRHRMFTTEDATGRTLCLRPDFTIPVCLDHLASGHTGPIAYTYEGKLFRKWRKTGDPEFEQAGVEWFGHEDKVEADAAVFALAERCARAAGLQPVVRVGDADLFAALTRSLGLSDTWVARLTRAFGDQRRVDAALARLTARTSGDGLAARLAPALARLPRDEAREFADAVATLYPDAGGSRTVADIAERLMAQAALEDGAPANAVQILRRYTALRAPLAEAADTVAAFVRAEGVALDGPLQAFATRTDAMARHGTDLSAISFQAGFGRAIGYYSGFLFDMTVPGAPDAEVIAGGRYDGLVALLDPARSEPAIGFSVWIDRLSGAA